MGGKVARLVPDVTRAKSEDELPTGQSRPILVDLANLELDGVTVGKATLAGGNFATGNFRRALQFAASGRADALFFTPFNKAAMRFAYPGYDDEIRFIRDVIGLTLPPASSISLAVVECARYLACAAQRGGAKHHRRPDIECIVACERRIARGRLRQSAHRRRRPQSARRRRRNFGREEIDVIEPAVAKAKAEGSMSRDRTHPTPFSCARRTAISTRC